jgi:hypothetical protein
MRKAKTEQNQIQILILGVEQKEKANGKIN